MVSTWIRQLVRYGLETGLTAPEDEIYTTNRLLDALGLENYEIPEEEVKLAEGPVRPLEEILKALLDDAVSRGVLEDSVVYRDLFDTRLMDCLMPRPAQVIGKFWKDYETSPETATDAYYKFSQDSDYIRRYRVCRDQKWVTPTEYGDLDITINLSKPEKDPKAIAAAKLAKQSGYPKCLLCREN